MFRMLTTLAFLLQAVSPRYIFKLKYKIKRNKHEQARAESLFTYLQPHKQTHTWSTFKPTWQHHI